MRLIPPTVRRPTHKSGRYTASTCVRARARLPLGRRVRARSGRAVRQRGWRSESLHFSGRHDYAQKGRRGRGPARSPRCTRVLTVNGTRVYTTLMTTHTVGRMGALTTSTGVVCRETKRMCSIRSSVKHVCLYARNKSVSLSHGDPQSHACMPIRGKSVVVRPC